MRELETEGTYADKIRFTIVPNSTPGFAKDVAGFGLGSHGLVGLSSSGEAVKKLPGHSYGKSEIIEVIQALLAG